MRSGTRAGRDAESVSRWSECFRMALRIMPHEQGHESAPSGKAEKVSGSDTDANDGWRVFAAELGLRIHRLRVEKGLSQEAVAYRAGITRFTYQRYEAGQGAVRIPGEPDLEDSTCLVTGPGGHTSGASSVSGAGFNRQVGVWPYRADRRGSGGAPGTQAHRRVIHRHDRERTRGISHLCNARALPSLCN